MLRQVIISILVACVAVGMAACGDTWQGVKKDTGENLDKAGQAIQRAGDKIAN